MEIKIIFFILLVLFLLLFFYFVNIYNNQIKSPQPTIIGRLYSCEPLKSKSICSGKYTIKWCVDFSNSNYDISTETPSFIYRENKKNIILNKDYYTQKHDEFGLSFYEIERTFDKGSYNIQISTLLEDKYESKPSKILKLTSYDYPEGGYKPTDFTYNKSSSCYSQNDTMIISWKNPIGYYLPELNYIWMIFGGENKLIAYCNVGKNTTATIPFTNNEQSIFDCDNSESKLYMDIGDYEIKIITIPEGCPAKTTYTPGGAITIVECINDEDCGNSQTCYYNTCKSLPPAPVITNDLNLCEAAENIYVCMKGFILTWCVNYEGSSYDPENNPPCFYFKSSSNNDDLKNFLITDNEYTSSTENLLYKYSFNMSDFGLAGEVYNITLTTKQSVNDICYASKPSNSLELTIYSEYNFNNFKYSGYNQNSDYTPTYNQNGKLVIYWNSKYVTGLYTGDSDYYYQITDSNSNLVFECKLYSSCNPNREDNNICTLHSEIQLGEGTICHASSARTQNLNLNPGTYYVWINTSPSICTPNYVKQSQPFKVVA